MQRLMIVMVTAYLLTISGLVQAQVMIDESLQIIVPPKPTIPWPRSIPPLYKVESVTVNSNIRDQIAKVQISQVFQNTGSSTLEARLLFPMPEDAAISGLTLIVDGKELTGQLLKNTDARRIYESIVRRRRDPALLEYMGQGLFQTNVFPVPPLARRTVEMRYSQLLQKENGLIDLLLPIGTNKHSCKPIETLNVNIRIKSSKPIKTVYSPTHEIDINRSDDRHAVCKLSLKNVVGPDDLRLFYGSKDGIVGMNVISYRPKKNEDGYFLLLASPEVKQLADSQVEKTVVFVVDRSGSMNGKKIEQTREAVNFLINQLQPRDSFNIVTYDTEVASFRQKLQKTDETTIQAALRFVDELFVGGGTNIDGALTAALNMPGESGRPSYVLFLTDGLPTVGERNELKIATNAKQANKYRARLFNFGVGFDVNSRLLDRLSRDHRGQSIYVRPNEDIEVHVSKLYRRIGLPLLTDLSVRFGFDNPRPEGADSGISRTYPQQLTDLFCGEQLVWVGRYRQPGHVKVTLSGSVANKRQSFNCPATLVKTSHNESNGFVEKLWATRRIGAIIDELDLRGHNKELIDELVRLSIRHGIITPYTSFLADENVRLTARDNVSRAEEFVARELDAVVGRRGFAQRALKSRLQNAARAGVGMTGSLVDEEFEYADDYKKVERTVRSIGQKTFFRKNQQWRDSTVTPEQEKEVIRVALFSKQYFDLAASHDGKLAKYLVFNDAILVNLGGTTYQIDPPAVP